ncbi:MAG: calcium/sodium antiporter [Firmicutes bacterium]|nr:calcium/sodium antiporter [Bacillota bacterium]
MEEIIQTYLQSFPTLALFLVIAAMLYTLSKGADILVDEAVGLSLQLGISKAIIGATIVSLGTTLPEASVSVLAALRGNPDLALGNAIGSIIVDTGLIIGLAVFFGRLPVSPHIVKRQGKIQVWAGILLAFVSLPFLGGDERIGQWVGWLFLALLVIYIYTSMKWSKSPEFQEAAALDGEEKTSIFLRLLKLFAGVFLVIASSRILIPAVEITAVRIGVPQSIIAATLVAFGTSLPELVTAITAARKGHGELAVGNIVGADILNVLFVVGGAAAVTKGGLHVPVTFYKLQIPAMLVILLVFRFFSNSTKQEEITRAEGLVLLCLYFIYLGMNYAFI